MDRRNNARYDIWLPVRIDELKEGVAVSHNASKNGMMIVTASRLSVGDDVTLTFKLPPDNEDERRIQGRVVRVGPNEKDPHGLWRYALGVEFEETIPELESLLQTTDSPAKNTPLPSSAPSSYTPSKKSSG